jgi:hypothetical protein
MGVVVAVAFFGQIGPTQQHGGHHPNSTPRELRFPGVRLDRGRGGATCTVYFNQPTGFKWKETPPARTDRAHGLGSICSILPAFALSYRRNCGALPP